MKSLLSLILLLACSSSLASQRGLAPSTGDNFGSWISKLPRGHEINTMVLYGKDEPVINQLAPLFAGETGFPKNSSQPLFVGAHFVVDRDPSTFTNKSLLAPKGIEVLSASSIKVVNQNPASIEFFSSKPIPLSSLNCSNRVHVITWKQIMQTAGLAEIAKAILAQGWQGANSMKITYQEVFNCDQYFVQSQVLTFYFPDAPGRTRILSLTQTYLNNVGYLVRQVMRSHIDQELLSLPGIIEQIGAQ